MKKNLKPKIFEEKKIKKKKKKFVKIFSKIFFFDFSKFFSVEILHMMSTLRMQFFSIIGQRVPEIQGVTHKLRMRIYYIDCFLYSIKKHHFESFEFLAPMNFGCIIYSSYGRFLSCIHHPDDPDASKLLYYVYGHFHILVIFTIFLLYFIQ